MKAVLHPGDKLEKGVIVDTTCKHCGSVLIMGFASGQRLPIGIPCGNCCQISPVWGLVIRNSSDDFQGKYTVEELIEELEWCSVPKDFALGWRKIKGGGTVILHKLDCGPLSAYLLEIWDNHMVKLKIIGLSWKDLSTGVEYYWDQVECACGKLKALPIDRDGLWDKKLAVFMTDFEEELECDF